MVGSSTNKVFNDIDERKVLFEVYPELSFYFSEGAPGIVTSNLNVELGIANGTKCRFHSISMTESSLDVYQEKLKTSNAGDVIELPEQPLCVNVLIENDIVKDHMDLSLFPNEGFVIPCYRHTEEEKIELEGSKICYHKFECELFFASTYDKLQGSTMDRLIIDINKSTKHYIKLEHFIVGYSRVRSINNIRRLPYVERVDKAVEYLGNLKHNENLIKFYNKEPFNEKVGEYYCHAYDKSWKKIILERKKVKELLKVNPKDKKNSSISIGMKPDISRDAYQTFKNNIPSVSMYV